MLTIRLQRAGKKNKADFRVVLAEKTAASQKKFIEVIGSYNPHTKTLGIRNQERLDYWVNEQHVDISATVRNLLITKDIIKGDKTKAFTVPKKEVVEEEAPAAPAASETSEETPEVTVEAVETPIEVPTPDTATPDTAPEITAEADSTPESPAEVAEVTPETPKEEQAA